MADISTPVSGKSGLTAQEIEDAVKGTGLVGTGAAFIAMEAAYNIRADFALAHAIIESNWGNSFFATNRNNLFGLDAYDSDPNNASSYASKAACIDYYGHFLRTYYLTLGAVYYAGDSAHGVFTHYSSSHDSEATSVVGVQNQIDAKELGQGPSPQPVAAEPAVGTVNSQVYIVQPSDGARGLSGIAASYGITLARLEQLNPKAGHPPGDFDIIWPGDRLNVSGATPPSVVPSSGEVDIQVPSGYNGYESVIAAKYGTTVDQLVSWNKAKYPQITPDFIEAGWTIRVR